MFKYFTVECPPSRSSIVFHVFLHNVSVNHTGLSETLDVRKTETILIYSCYTLKCTAGNPSLLFDISSSPCYQPCKTGPHSASPDTPSWQSWPPQGRPRPRPRPPRGASGGGGHLPLLRPFLPLVLIDLLCSPSLPSFLPFSPSVFLFWDLRLFSYRPLALSLVSLAAVSNAREIGS